MRILFLVTAHNSLSQRVSTVLSDPSYGHHITVEYAATPEAMVEAANLANPDIILCPFLTRKVPREVYGKYLTLIVHPGAPGDAGPSALDWVLMGDTGSSSSGPETLNKVASASLPTKPRSHWAVTVLQAEEEFDQGPVWAWEQFDFPATPEIDGSACASITKASLYRGQVTRAAVIAVLAALERINAASLQRATGELAQTKDDLPSTPTSNTLGESMEPLKQDFPVDLEPPADAKLSVTLKVPFLGLTTHTRPLLRPADRALACDPRFHSAAACAATIRAGDSQPGVLVRWLDPRDSATVQGRNLFIYGAWVEENRLPSWTEHLPVGRIVATRDGAVLIKTPDRGRQGGYGLWLTHVRVPLAKGASGGLNPKLPAEDGLRAAGLGAALQGAREWIVAGKVVEEGKEVELGWLLRPGTWQQTWVEFEELRDGGKAVYIYFDYYNGACTTYQCQQLLAALQWATSPERGNLKFLVMMGGSYFSNGIALNTIEGSDDPSLESWKNINAINDVVELVISDSSPVAKRLAENSQIDNTFKPMAGLSLTERGILTVASVRSNVAAGGFALATAADIVLASESAVINPHYRGVGLFGSEFHTYSFFERAGDAEARKAIRGMLPMSATEACKLGFVDEVMKGGDADGYVERTKAYVRRLAAERVGAINEYKTAPWTRTKTEFDSTRLLTDALLANKLATHAAFTHPLVSYRHAELSQMLLDFYHPERSKRYASRRRAFVRKLAPTSTPLRFATHRRKEGEFDEEEKDEFDHAEGWAAGTGVEWGWIALPAPPQSEAWQETIPAVETAPPSEQAHHSTLLLAPSITGEEVQTPALSAGSSVTRSSDDAHITPPESPRGKLDPIDEGKLAPDSAVTRQGRGRSRSFVATVKSLRRKSDAPVRAPELDADVPPVPSATLQAPSPHLVTRTLRRSRSSVEWGSRDLTTDLARAAEANEARTKARARPPPAARISRWFGTTIKSMVRPGTATGERTGTGEPAKKAEVQVAGEGQEVLYPCYYNNTPN